MVSVQDKPGRIKKYLERNETLVDDLSKSVVEIQNLVKYYVSEQIQNQIQKEIYDTDSYMYGYHDGLHEAYTDHIYEMEAILASLKGVEAD